MVGNDCLARHHPDHAKWNGHIRCRDDGLPCPYTPTLIDIDSNIYNTVQIGLQCWMKENLRTTRYADSTFIPAGSATSSTNGYRYLPYNNENIVSTYGYLYNWPAVMNGASTSYANPSGVQGVCPTGWHVPSDAEWTQLTNYVRSQTEFICGDTNVNIAKALASTIDWSISINTCAVGTTLSDNFTGEPPRRTRDRHDGLPR